MSSKVPSSKFGTTKRVMALPTKSLLVSKSKAIKQDKDKDGNKYCWDPDQGGKRIDCPTTGKTDTPTQPPTKPAHSEQVPPKTEKPIVSQPSASDTKLRALETTALKEGDYDKRLIYLSVRQAIKPYDRFNPKPESKPYNAEKDRSSLDNEPIGKSLRRLANRIKARETDEKQNAFYGKLSRDLDSYGLTDDEKTRFKDKRLAVSDDKKRAQAKEKTSFESLWSRQAGQTQPLKQDNLSNAVLIRFTQGNTVNPHPIHKREDLHGSNANLLKGLNKADVLGLHSSRVYFLPEGVTADDLSELPGIHAISLGENTGDEPEDTPAGQLWEASAAPEQIPYEDTPSAARYAEGQESDMEKWDPAQVDRYKRLSRGLYVKMPAGEDIKFELVSADKVPRLTAIKKDLLEKSIKSVAPSPFGRLPWTTKALLPSVNMAPALYHHYDSYSGKSQGPREGKSEHSDMFGPSWTMKCTECGPYKVRVVSGEDIRNASLDLEEFGLSAIHQDFPGNIPEGEVWVAERVPLGEFHFIMSSQIARLKALKKGKSDSEAYEIGLKKDKSEREKMSGKGHHRFAGSEIGYLPVVDKTGYVTIMGDGSEPPITVYLVDGGIVRSTFKTDFLEGANHGPYSWTPKDEIWIESGLDPHELAVVGLHEYVERELMLHHGLGYDRAHELASYVEFQHRPDFTQEDLAQLTPAVLNQIPGFEEGHSRKSKKSKSINPSPFGRLSSHSKTIKQGKDKDGDKYCWDTEDEGKRTKCPTTDSADSSSRQETSQSQAKTPSVTNRIGGFVGRLFGREGKPKLVAPSIKPEKKESSITFSNAEGASNETEQQQFLKDWRKTRDQWTITPSFNFDNLRLAKDENTSPNEPKVIGWVGWSVSPEGGLQFFIDSRKDKRSNVLSMGLLKQFLSSPDLSKIKHIDAHAFTPEGRRMIESLAKKLKVPWKGEDLSGERKHLSDKRIAVVLKDGEVLGKGLLTQVSNGKASVTFDSGHSGAFPIGMIKSLKELDLITPPTFSRLSWNIKAIKEGKTKKGHRYCWDPEKGGKRVPCPPKISPNKDEEFKTTKEDSPKPPEVEDITEQHIEEPEEEQKPPPVDKVKAQQTVLDYIKEQGDAAYGELHELLQDAEVPKEEHKNIVKALEDAGKITLGKDQYGRSVYTITPEPKSTKQSTSNFNRTAVENDLVDINQPDSRSGLPPLIPELYDKLKEKHPNMSETDFHNLLKDMERQDKLTLQTWGGGGEEQLVRHTGFNKERFPPGGRSGYAAWVQLHPGLLKPKKQTPKVEPKPEPEQKSSPHLDHITQKIDTGLENAKDIQDWQREEYKNANQSVLSKMPPKALERIANYMGEVKFYPNIKTLGKTITKDAVDELLKNKKIGFVKRQIIKATGWLVSKAIGMGLIGIGGSVRSDTGDISLDGSGSINIAGHQDYKISASEPTFVNQMYAHEWTHIIDGPKYDKDTLKASHEMSDKPEWQDAWKSEIKSKDKKNYPLTQYGASKVTEGFAEFGRLLYAGKVSLDKVEERFPKCSKFFKENGLWPV